MHTTPFCAYNTFYLYNPLMQLTLSFVLLNQQNMAMDAILYEMCETLEVFPPGVLLRRRTAGTKDGYNIIKYFARLSSDWSPVYTHV